MNYEDLLMEADKEGLDVREKPLTDYNGRIKGKRIAIRKDIPTLKEKSCILAEELGHYYTTYGDILDQSDINNRKQELKARLRGYDIRIGLLGIVNCFNHGCHNPYEMAEYLNVTEEYMLEALKCYTSKYGTRYIVIDAYLIQFEPKLAVMKNFE